MDSENDSAIWRTFWLAVLVLAITAGVAACGAPVLNSSGLSWDNSLWANREAQRTERERLRLAAETRQAMEREETARIMSDNMMTTLQWLAVTGGIVGGLAVAGWATQRSVAAWAARPHRPAAPPPAQIIVMAAPYLESDRTARVEQIEADGYRGWAVLYPRTERFVPLQLTDGQHRG